jgi:hypothetical protein
MPHTDAVIQRLLAGDTVPAVRAFLKTAYPDMTEGARNLTIKRAQAKALPVAVIVPPPQVAAKAVGAINAAGPPAAYPLVAMAVPKVAPMPPAPALAPFKAAGPFAAAKALGAIPVAAPSVVAMAVPKVSPVPPTSAIAHFNAADPSAAAVIVPKVSAVPPAPSIVPFNAFGPFPKSALKASPPSVRASPILVAKVTLLDAPATQPSRPPVSGVSSGAAATSLSLEAKMRSVAEQDRWGALWASELNQAKEAEKSKEAEPNQSKTTQEAGKAAELELRKRRRDAEEAARRVNSRYGF